MRPQVTKPEPEPSTETDPSDRDRRLRDLRPREGARPASAELESPLGRPGDGAVRARGRGAARLRVRAHAEQRHERAPGGARRAQGTARLAGRRRGARARGDVRRDIERRPLQRPHAGLLRRRARLLLHRPCADRGADHGQDAGDHAGAHRRPAVRHGSHPRGRGEARAAHSRGLGRVVRRALQGPPRRLVRRRRLLLDVRRACHLDGRRRRLHDRRPRAADADEEPHEPRPGRRVHANRRRHGRG